jgi:predicted ATPase/DNA-binding CsgD family transcriptional regulator
LFEQVLTVLRAAAAESPLALVIEDVHWADRSTADFLAFLVRAARREAIAVIVTYRPDDLHRRHPVRPIVLDLERLGAATRIELRPLTRAELREQVTAILDAAPPPLLLDTLLERSEGNPFFTEELLAASRADTEELPRSLRDILLSRVEAQEPSVQDVLRLAAVAGRTVDHPFLAAAAGLAEDELNAVLRTAVENALLTHDSTTARYAFRHALLREAIYSDLLPGERRALHRSLAQTLSAQPDLAGRTAVAQAELAYHWYAAGELPTALHASLIAGLAAEEVRALGEAWLHWRRALEIWNRLERVPDDLPLNRRDVLRRAADAAVLTGDTSSGLRLARELLSDIDERADPVSAALAHERLGRYLWIDGCGEGSLPEYRRAVELMPAQPRTEQLARVLAAEGQALMLCHRLTESYGPCEQALAIARDIGAEAVEAHVLNTMSGNLSATGDLDRAFQSAQAALAIGQRLRLTEEIHRSYVNGSDALHQQGRTEESIAFAQEGVRSARAFGMSRNMGDFLLSEIAGRLFDLGRWSEAQAVLDDVLDRGPSGVAGAIAYLHLGRLTVQRAEFDAASRQLEEAAELSSGGGSMWVGPQAAAEASLELWRGHPQRAVRIIEDCLAQIVDAEHVYFSAGAYAAGARAYADLAQRAIRDEDAARRYAEHARRLIAQLDRGIAIMTAGVPPCVVAFRTTCAAEVARIDVPADATPWRHAQEAWDALGDPFSAAYAAWRRAEALLAAGGERSPVERLLRDAYAAARDLDARPLREEVERLARRTRLELDPTMARPGAPSEELARFELTARELEVLALLEAGMTNRQIAGELFISEKTASVHVSRILAKLAVPNRAAAAAAAQRLGAHSHVGTTAG